MKLNGTSPARILLAAVAAALALSLAAAQADVYDDLVTWTPEQGRATLAAIEAETREAATPKACRAIERKLLKILGKREATVDAKQFACRVLRQVGTADCVSVVAKLLPDPKLSHAARFTLEGMAGADAATALRKALPKLQGELQLGVVASLGERRDAASVPALALLAASPDEATARAAIHALGRIATADAAKALAAAQAGEKLQAEWADATLLCADAMLASGLAPAAADAYRKMAAEGQPKFVRIAALRGLVLAEKEKAAETVLALLKDKDADLRQAGSKFVIETPGPAATAAFAAALASLPPETQVLLVDALTARGDTTAGPAVAQLIESQDKAVRIAALKALGTLGDASVVPALAKAASAGEEIGPAAAQSLNRLKGPGVSDAMAKLLDSPDTALRTGIVGVLATRADKTMTPVMLKAARDQEAAVRQAAVKGLAAVAAQQELPELVALLVAAKEAPDRDALKQALSAATLRVDDPEARTAPLVAGLANADPAAKAILISLLGRLGGEKALGAVRAQLASPDADVATEAVRALHAWPDASPAPDLLNLIKTAKNPAHKTLAFRGYVRMAGLPSERPAAETMAMYTQALELATTGDEKKAVLAGLGTARSADALKLVEGLLAQDALKAEAELATVQIADNLRDGAPDEAKAALGKVAASTKDNRLRQRAQAILREIDQNKGFVRSWLGCGPFTGGNLFDTAFAPEKSDAKPAWKVLADGVGPQAIDLEKAIGGGDNRVAYARTFVWSPEDQDVQLQIGSDDGVKVWLGGKQVHANNATRPCRPGEDKAAAKLAKGWNPLLVKIIQGGGQWAFCLRICKPDGAALDGLRVSVEQPQ